MLYKVYYYKATTPVSVPLTFVLIKSSNKQIAAYRFKMKNPLFGILKILPFKMV